MLPHQKSAQPVNQGPFIATTKAPPPPYEATHRYAATVPSLLPEPSPYYIAQPARFSATGQFRFFLPVPPRGTFTRESFGSAHSVQSGGQSQTTPIGSGDALSKALK